MSVEPEVPESTAVFSPLFYNTYTHEKELDREEVIPSPSDQAQRSECIETAPPVESLSSHCQLLGQHLLSHESLHLKLSLHLVRERKGLDCRFRLWVLG